MSRLLPAIVVVLAVPIPARADEGITFLVTSDSHYDAFENEDRNQRNRVTIDEMNRIGEVAWPEGLGGDRIPVPRSVLLLGDVLDDADRLLRGKSQGPHQYRAFLAQFGLDGTDGLLKYPVYEGWGNHDGPPAGKQRHDFSFQAELEKRNRLRLDKGLIANLSANGLHYSWDCGGVHFVQLNLYPGDHPHPKTRYSPVYHDPQGSLTFLKEDLAKNIGDSGRPVVLAHHYDLQGTDWWHDEERTAYYDAVKDYNVVVIFHGHTGTGVYRWCPEGRGGPIDVVNTGQTENGFFVVQITPTRLRLAYRMKDGVRIVKDDLGKVHHHWDGAWGWRHVLDRRLTAPRRTSGPMPSGRRLSTPRPTSGTPAQPPRGYPGSGL